MNLRWLNALLWGNSVALSWMWGLGLFFSVQVTYMFGFRGLLMFAIPNALGLIFFGIFTQKVANREKGRSESLAIFFDKFSRPFRLVFYIYQILALSLTIFALVRYLFIPLELATGNLFWLYVPMVILVIIAAGCLLGEEFGIGKIKLSHAGLGVIVLVAIAIIVFNLNPGYASNFKLVEPFRDDWHFSRFWGLAIPFVIGLLVGPWLDLQHWQRAIQIHREQTSVRGSYLTGGIIFFLLILFHGGLAYWVMGKTNNAITSHLGLDGLNYCHEMIVQYFSRNFAEGGELRFYGYCSFLTICVVTTLDSGYIALKWFLGNSVAKSDNMLLSLIPKQFISSPLLSFALCGMIAFIGIVAKLELEYFMVFFASFFVGYAALAIARCFVPNSQEKFPQIRMLSMAIISVAVFSFGYLRSENLLMILGSIMPFAYVIWLVFNADLFRLVTEKTGIHIESNDEIIGSAPQLMEDAPALVHVGAPAKGHSLHGHFEDKWFVYSSIASYSDTNSVGNVYFGMYGMFVGKARELFFNQVMPFFDLKTTNFFILTRSYEHKFVREAKEFDTIVVKIRVAEYNRKFCTLEHQIFDSENHLLGKGKQSLMFVAAANYGLIDIPAEVHSSFMKYL
jgi:acyl-CoA thioesterase FadM